mmetsp:Transcript_7201/g.13651  ORF Transcript_7201/g.13651 Transcript_7201/m.13651 type:complete len:228 (-) Transcript_7201:450-1133(-)
MIIRKWVFSVAGTPSVFPLGFHQIFDLRANGIVQPKLERVFTMKDPDVCDPREHRRTCARQKWTDFNKHRFFCVGKIDQVCAVRFLPNRMVELSPMSCNGILDCELLSSKVGIHTIMIVLRNCSYFSFPNKTSEFVLQQQPSFPLSKHYLFRFTILQPINHVGEHTLAREEERHRSCSTVDFQGWSPSNCNEFFVTHTGVGRVRDTGQLRLVLRPNCFTIKRLSVFR